MNLELSLPGDAPPPPKPFRPALLVGMLLGILALVIGAMAFDEPVQDWWMRGDHRQFRSLAVFFTKYGDWPVIAGLCAIGFVVAWRKAKTRWMHILALMLAASILAGAIVNPLRVLTGRARPNATVLQGWYGVRHQGNWTVGKYRFSSFPSAHSAVIVAFAVPLICFAPRAAIFGVIFAAGVVWSRIYLGAHHVLDVTVGCIIGAISGVVVCSWLRFRVWLARWIARLNARKSTAAGS